VFGVLAISTLTTAHTSVVAGAFGPAAGQLPVSHVFWVDDNPENNADIIRALAERGVAVTTVHSTAEALERFDPAIYQFVVSDLGRYEGERDTFVGRAGFELLERLRARADTLRFVFYTSGRAAELNRSEALAAGALDMVADPDAVLRLIGIRP
jgi:CheY-like chemotaxis protein